MQATVNVGKYKINVNEVGNIYLELTNPINGYIHALHVRDKFMIAWLSDVCKVDLVKIGNDIKKGVYISENRLNTVLQPDDKDA